MPYDVLIVGGGIHGAACALLAAEQNLKVLLLEQYAQPGLATSSKSSKLIHGGLRYLETGQFKLVRECLNERRYLLQHYPDLVKLVAFHIPVYRHTSRRPWLIRTGLAIYSLFSGKRFKSFSPRELDGLKTEHLQTIFRYYDAQTDDRALTQKVMEQATCLGATILTSAEFGGATIDDTGCTIRYTRSGHTHTEHCKVILNCAGPWVNDVLNRIQPAPSQRNIERVLGSHIVVPGQLEYGMYYLEAPQDRRAVFVMPWKDATLIGTTETRFHGDPHDVTPPESDIQYLLDVHNHYFQRQLTRADVVDAFAGLRVLPASDGSAFHRPRDTIIHHDTIPQPRVFSLYGGKLTAHRATARQVLRSIQPYL
jgi:glycerol-3-phosphate dehydrogenase